MISDEQFKKIAPTGSQPGILYGLPKIHKANVPLRPILSAIGTHSFNLAKFLVSLLHPISLSSYVIINSFSFIQELFSLDLNTDDLVMASFDVTSLFTNIPLDETIQIILDQLFSTNRLFPGISRKELKDLLNLTVKDCHFVFNGKLYDQIDGVAMGSPLGPLFANIFLSHHEKIWLKNCPTDFKPLFYRHNVDDSFILFKSREHIEPFLNYLNSQHPKINFTCEVESNKMLPFLDITISQSNGSFITSVYPKPTFTSFFTNFESFLPVIYKKGLIYTILFRYLNICLWYSTFQEELAKFKSLLLQNGYPLWFIDYCICSFLIKVSDTQIKPLTAPKLQLLIALPFTGGQSQNSPTAFEVDIIGQPTH